MMKLTVTLLVFGFLGCQAYAQVSEAERGALIEFYHATGGDEWHDNGGWPGADNTGWLGPEGTECQWRGVVCSDSSLKPRHVVELRIPGNGLSGYLPGRIGDLHWLGSLSLYDNELEGPIPEVVGGLPLRALNLGGNRFSGLIPGTLLTRQISVVWIENNLLEGFGESEGPVPDEPKVFKLAGNRITELPPDSWRRDEAIINLDLSNNLLEGDISLESAAWPGLRILDLSENAITALTDIDADTLVDVHTLGLADNLIDRGIEHLFTKPGLEILTLSRNPLGSLPETVAGPLAPLRILQMAHSELEGEIPDWFAGLALHTLGLSYNQLSGTIDNVIAALDSSGERSLIINLSENDFSGPIPEAVLGLQFWSGQTNLCWNRFDEPIGDVFEEALRHDGRPLALCNSRERRDMHVDISGTWYAPELSGQGYNVMLLENGSLIAYWWGYPEYFVPGEQMWLFNMVVPTGPSARMESFVWPWPGDFGKGQSERGRVAEIQAGAEFRFDALADGKLHAYSSIPNFWDYVQSSSIMSPALAGSSHSGKGESPQLSPAPPPVRDRRDLSRLTWLAGTSCDNQHPGQEMSGLWYDPQRSGEGFVVEVIGDGRALAYWFTYTPDGAGNQAWMIGDGSFDGATLNIDNLVQPVGGGFGPNFDPADVDRVHWGTLTLEFFDGSSGHIYWDSVFEEYGAGDYPIQRLARARLAECEAD